MQIKTETLVGLFVLLAGALFIYMSMHVGAFRLDRNRYASYTLSFTNVSGLNVKADVKIAGVKVGWVDSLSLLQDHARVIICVLRDYHMYADAHAIVRQDGLLGSRYLEIIPGTSTLPCIESGGFFADKQSNPVALDELLMQFKQVSANMAEITTVLKSVITEKNMHNSLGVFNEALEKCVAVCSRMDALVAGNQENVTALVSDLKEVAQVLKKQLPSVTDACADVVPPLRDVIKKIDAGKGILGQLVNDSDSAHDVKAVVSGIKRYFDKVNRIAIIVDSYWESLYNTQHNFCFENGKGYLNMRIHPAADYFYLVGVTASLKGRIRRFEELRSWQTCAGTSLKPSSMSLPDWAKLEYAPRKSRAERECNAFLLNVQFGKIYRDWAFRFGLFEGTGGIAVDYDVPLGVRWARWVTTFEAFDFRGRNRFNDTRPHLTWLNRFYINNHLYGVFGFDDFVSKNTKSIFFGAGIRFSDDDIKYFTTG